MGGSRQRRARIRAQLTLAGDGGIWESRIPGGVPVATGPPDNSRREGARTRAALHLVRAEDAPCALQHEPEIARRRPDAWSGFRKRILRGDFLSEAAHRGRRQRRASQRRRWFHVSAVVAPPLCLAGALALFLTLYADTYYTTEELRRRVAEVEAQATLIRMSSEAPSAERSPETAAVSPPAGNRSSGYVSAASDVGEYTVRKRDNLWNVVKRECDLKGDLIAPAVEYVKRLNGITNVKRMQPGDRILLPSRDQLMKISGGGPAPEQP